MGSGAGALFRAVGFYAGPEPTVTADNVLDALIAFANGDVSPRRPAEDERRRARRMLTAAAEGVINPLSKSLLAWLSNDTLSNMSGRQVHRTPACREVHQTPDFSYAHPSTNYKTAKLEWRLDGPRSARAWIRFAAFVLADTAKNDRTSVGQCKWDQCRRFFRVVIRDRGQPARNYCPGTNHQAKARPISTDRVRKWRIDKAKEAALLKRRAAAKHK